MPSKHRTAIPFLMRRRSDPNGNSAVVVTTTLMADDDVRNARHTIPQTAGLRKCSFKYRVAHHHVKQADHDGRYNAMVGDGARRSWCEKVKKNLQRYGMSLRCKEPSTHRLASVSFYAPHHAQACSPSIGAKDFRCIGICLGAVVCDRSMVDPRCDLWSRRRLQLPIDADGHRGAWW